MFQICSQSEFDNELNELVEQYTSFDGFDLYSVGVLNESFTRTLQISMLPAFQTHIKAHLFEAIGMRLYVKTLCEQMQFNQDSFYEYLTQINPNVDIEASDIENYVAYREYMFAAKLGFQTPITIAEHQSGFHGFAFSCIANNSVYSPWVDYIPNKTNLYAVSGNLESGEHKQFNFSSASSDSNISIIHSNGKTMDIYYVSLKKVLNINKDLPKFLRQHILCILHFVDAFSIALPETYIKLLMDELLSIESVVKNVLDKPSTLPLAVGLDYAVDTPAVVSSVHLGVVLEGVFYTVDGVRKNVHRTLSVK